jgi:hypothetical protein
MAVLGPSIFRYSALLPLHSCCSVSLTMTCTFAEELKWVQAPLELPIKRLSHSSTQVGSYLFVFAGHDGSGYKNDLHLFNLGKLSFISCDCMIVWSWLYGSVHACALSASIPSHMSYFMCYMPYAYPTCQSSLTNYFHFSSSSQSPSNTNTAPSTGASPPLEDITSPSCKTLACLRSEDSMGRMCSTRCT